jgi:hypothetical protein
MQKITTRAGLREVIQDLESKQTSEWRLVREQVLNVCESLKLVNVIKRTLKNTLSDPDLGLDIADTAIGLTTGFIAKKALIGKTNNPFKKLFGLILEMTVARKVANNADSIKKMSGILLNKIIHPKSGSDAA